MLRSRGEFCTNMFFMYSSEFIEKVVGNCLTFSSSVLLPVIFYRAYFLR